MRIYCCSRDETPKAEFVDFSGKIDILATLGVQKCYFEVSSSALSYTWVNSWFRYIFIKNHAHFSSNTR